MAWITNTMLLFQISGFLSMKFGVFRMKTEQAVSIPVNPACWSMEWFSAQICHKGRVCVLVVGVNLAGRKFTKM